MDARQDSKPHGTPGELDQRDLRIAELLLKNQHTLQQIADDVGLHKSTVAYRMKRPPFRKMIQTIRQAEIQRAMVQLSSYAGTITAKLITSLVSGEMDEAARVDRLISVLERLFGLFPKPQGAPLVQVNQQQQQNALQVPQPTYHHMTDAAAQALQEAEKVFLRALGQGAQQDRHSAGRLPEVIEAEDFETMPGFQEEPTHGVSGPEETAEPQPGGQAAPAVPEVPNPPNHLRPVAAAPVQPTDLPQEPPDGLSGGGVGTKRSHRHPVRRARKGRHGKPGGTNGTA